MAGGGSGSMPTIGIGNTMHRCGYGTDGGVAESNEAASALALNHQ
jgi:hypothetical protein